MLIINRPYGLPVAFFVPILSVAMSPLSQQPQTAPRVCGTGVGLAACWGFDLVVLLNEPLVRGELSLTPDQVAKQHQLVDQYLNSLKPLLLAARKTQALPKAQRDAALAELARQQHQLTRDFGKRATEILTAPQRTRLMEITFQLRGVDAFFTEEITELLSLDDRQHKEIQQVRDWLVGEIHQLRVAGPSSISGVEANRADLSLLRKQAQKRITALLRDDQLDQVTRLRGRPIDFLPADLSMVLRQRSKAGAESGGPGSGLEF